VDCDTAAAHEADLTERPPESQASAEDEGLARRIAAGEVAAWDHFFDRFCDWAYRFAYYHLSANRADAEDLCSDILMTAARGIKQFDGARGTLDVWLLGIARHRLARFCRRRRLEVPLDPEPSGSQDVDARCYRPRGVIATSVGSRAHEGAPIEDAALTRQLVNRALASLPQRQAAVLVGKYVAGYTVEELARSNDMTPKAVESLLTRARAGFRAAFATLNESSGGDNRG